MSGGVRVKNEIKQIKTKNVLLVILALALTAAISVAITYAFRDRTEINTVENTFTNGNITVALYECKWDGVNGPNDNFTYTDENDLGKNMALHYSQGTMIPKNPRVANISNPDATGFSADELKAWVGIKAQFYAIIEETDAYGNVKNNVYEYTGKQFNDSIAEIYCNGYSGLSSRNWRANDDWTEFYYKNPVYNKSSTDELFDALVAVHLETTSDKSGETMYVIPYFVPNKDQNGKITGYERKTVNSYSMPDFNVDLKAYALQYQAEGNSYTEARIAEKLHILMNYQTQVSNTGNGG